ncbi:hypothetical protein [Shouchella clausii]|uniref:hypothetical protein n=1 Tax=Shouchella clausii TaxID=79880 RepID=UPI000BA7811F|nr:hypothetical protein [Shouchella clausii]PAD91649.1 hypothetical protein CHH52_13585 [Shouchella clausii]
MDELLRNIKELLEDAEVAAGEIDERFPKEDYDPSSWSGGNFDDAYELGLDHGEVTGELQTLKRVIAIIEARR